MYVAEPARVAPGRLDFGSRSSRGQAGWPSLLVQRGSRFRQDPPSSEGSSAWASKPRSKCTVERVSVVGTCGVRLLRMCRRWGPIGLHQSGPTRAEVRSLPTAGPSRNDNAALSMGYYGGRLRVAARAVVHREMVFCGAGVGCCGAAGKQAGRGINGLTGYPEDSAGTH
jgi:hypothetical protein